MRDTIFADEGFYFGLGLFETIAVVTGRPLFLDEHLQRINASLRHFKIAKRIEKEMVYEYLNDYFIENGALKIAVSADNIVFSQRENPYDKARYQQGFALTYSKVFSNETSPFTYHKTLNYGNNILEKQKALNSSFDEALFLNSQGEITEGTTTNIFFIKQKGIFTPKVSCGLLNGVLRQYIIKKYHVTEMTIHPTAIAQFEECFLTNALLGVMPVHCLDQQKFSSMVQGQQMRATYEKEILQQK